jgi:hypothetical protein
VYLEMRANIEVKLISNFTVRIRRSLLQAYENKGKKLREADRIT